MRIYKIQYCATLLVVVSLLLSVCVSCTDDIDLQMERQKAGFTIVGDPVQVHFSVSVSDLSVVATRAEEPATVDDADKSANEEEKHISDLWIFEYDAATSALIYTPQRVSITDQKELEDVDVTLSNNRGEAVVIYVVANAGSGVEENSKNWVNNESSGYEGFSTIEELKAQAIPTPHPQRMTWDATEGEYVLDTQDAAELSIPMAGSVGEDESESVTVDAGAEIKVSVERMFAKMMLMVDLSDFENQTDQTAWLNTLTIGNIPEYCTVGTLWDGEKGDDAQAADYTACKQWLQRRFTNDKSTGSGGEGGDGETETIYPYIIYMPENIQGESTGESTDKAENAPEGNALTAEVALYVTDENDVTSGPYTYTAYPGGNTTTNFNVRRNCVYRVTLKVTYPISLDMVPSANCIICPSGETTAFCPYYRTEEGGGYDFEDYLYAYDDGSKQGQKIDHVGIIWQSTDGGNTVNYYSDTATGYIGDNSEGDLVWIDDVDNEKVIDEFHRRIYVKIPEGNTGNALIGAYNSDGDIIWSWHIWSRARENDPTTVNTKLYYTYEWDNDGIQYDRNRVAGYTIMNCNLGAMKDEPAGSITGTTDVGGGENGFNNARQTFGTLYQWGRKDPFPPVTKFIVGLAYGGNHESMHESEEYSPTTVGNYFDNGNDAVSIVGTDTPDALFHSVPGTERKSFDEMIPLTIQNPTVFYAGTNELNQKSADYIETDIVDNMPEPKDGNWMLDSGSDHFNRLWGGLDPEQDMDQITKSYDTGLTCKLGDVSDIPIHLYDDYGEKSIFDPCPYGWRVPPPDLWLGFTVDGLNAGTNNNTDLDNVNYNTDPDYSWYSGLTMYLTAWRSGATSFFPCQGTRAPDGCAYKCGQCGNYNNATADANDRVNTLHIHNRAQNFNIFEYRVMAYYTKSTAGPIRCVRIDSAQQ